MKNNLFVCFAGQSWDTPLRTNRHYMMRNFANKNSVIFIESLGLRTPTTSSADIIKIFKKLYRSFFGARKTEIDNLFALDPIIIPMAISDRFFILDKLNRYLFMFQIKLAIKKLNRINCYKAKLPIILWSYIPSVLPFVGRFKEKLLVYDCVDDCSGVSGFSEKMVEQDSELAKVSNVVFALSKPIYNDKKKLNKNVCYAPGAADFKLFGKALDKNTLIPDDIEKISNPILGYIGNLADHKQDFGLLEFVAKKKPKWSIVLIGPKWSGNEKGIDSFNKIERLPNVHWLGIKKHSDLPSYIKGFDVCIIPQKKNIYSRSSFPMKLYEYLGSGKPVVATFTEALAEFKNVIWLSSSANDFIKGIKYYLEKDSDSDRSFRIDLAKNNSWETRFDLLEKKVSETLNEN